MVLWLDEACAQHQQSGIILQHFIVENSLQVTAHQ
jgi:hypothetical protein